MKKLYVVLIVFFVSYSNLEANHMLSGRIYYQWMYGTTYKIILEKYWQCDGLGPIPQIPACFYDSTSGNVNTNLLFTRDTIFDVSIVCDTLPNTCQSVNNIWPGWKMVRYSLIHDFGNSNHWKFGSTECCYIQLDNMDQGSVIETVFLSAIYLNNASYNNSAYTPIGPVISVPVNQLQQIDLSAIDPDGDSLVYSLEKAWEQTCYSMVEADYTPGFSYLQPISTYLTGGVTLNSQTGILSFTPTTIENDLVVYRITEYRNGLIVGLTHRAIQVKVTTDLNSRPVISGMNGGSTNSITICAGDSVNFTVFTSDANLDSTSISHYYFTGTDDVFIINPGVNESGTFSWITDSTDSASSPYIFALTSQDKNCPFNGYSNKAFIIQVNYCANNDVWPGDANSDKNVDASDLLPIGLAYGATGPIRPSASLSWNAQPCQGWSQFLSSGTDYKHSDCDGNGVVDSFDVQGITTNFGQSHLRLAMSPNKAAFPAAELKITLSKDTVAPGETISGVVSIGDASNLFSGYGIGFDIQGDPTTYSFNSGDFIPSMLLGNNILNFNQISFDRVNSAVTRYNLINANGYGDIFSFTLTANAGISVLTNSNLTFSSSEYSDAAGYISPIGNVGAPIVIDPLLTIEDHNQNTLFTAFLNSGNLIINYTGNYKNSVAVLTNMLGQEIKMWPLNADLNTCSVAGIQPGIYLLSLTDNATFKSKKIYIPITH
ncbi:MAG: T9SS type A sorting domain-containing protein [Bacteroidota bacterium]|nr:T9SS type A sorting domain-containing protein [Bacteroidota bacterium]